VKHAVRIPLIGLAVIVGLATAASAAQELSSLAGSEWGFRDEQGPHARFVHFAAGGRVNGHGGCNRFGGSFTQSGEDLRIGPLAATRMACPANIMQLENDFLRILDATAKARATHLELTLMGADGKVLATLARHDAD
jgi:heat shock protein HslJ